MRRTWLLGLGVVLLGGACGCSSDDGPGSTIGQMSGGGGGSGGQAGTLSFTEFQAGAGSGGVGGVGGVGGANGGSSGSFTFGGASLGGSTSQAGSNTGTGGSKPGGMCMRATGSDGSCSELYSFDPEFPEDPARPQAYSCPDRSAYSTLNAAHAGKCANVTFVTGANTGACCPP
jgi:hypothetical protein